MPCDYRLREQSEIHGQVVIGWMGDIRRRFSDRRHDRITLSRLRGSRLGAVKGLDRGINDRIAQVLETRCTWLGVRFDCAG